jgi:hypothetical protein
MTFLARVVRVSPMRAFLLEFTKKYIRRNFMKLLTAIFIVMLLAFSSVSAQKEGQPAEEIVLAEGAGNLTQPMVNRVIDFFEWSLEVKLSGAARAELQGEIIENWKKRDCREIEGVRRVLRLADDAKNWDAEDAGQMRALYKNRFLKEFERNRTDNINSLILSGFSGSGGNSKGLATDLEQ